MEDNKKRAKQRLTLILTLVINLAIVGYIAVREFRADARDVSDITTLDVNLIFLLVGAACFGVALLMEYVKYREMIMSAEGRDDPRGAFQCAALGKYYDNITPFGAGGQPFQIHCLRQRGHSVGTSSALPIAGFFVLQAAFVLIAAVVFICNRQIIDVAPVIRYSAYVGLLMYMTIPLAIVLFAAFPKAFQRLIRGATRFLGKIHILKDGEKTAERVCASLDEYVTSFRALNKRPHFFARQLFYSVVYQLAILSIPYFVLRAFGGANDWWTVFSLTVYIYAAITVIPTPGNAGAAEGSFYAVFSSLESGYLFWAMILWRVLVYYSWLTVGLIVMARNAVPRPERTRLEVPTKGSLRVALVTDFCQAMSPELAQCVHTSKEQIRSRGDYACVIDLRGKEETPAESEPDVFSTPLLRLWRLRIPIARQSLSTMLLGERLSAIQIHTPFYLGGFAARFGRRHGIPVAAVFHGEIYDRIMNPDGRKFLRDMLANRIINLYCKVDEVWVYSQENLDLLRSYGYQGKILLLTEDSGEPDLELVPEGELKTAQPETKETDE